MQLILEVDRETDGRLIAEVAGLAARLSRRAAPRHTMNAWPSMKAGRVLRESISISE
jgi:hypothetical protein